MTSFAKTQFVVAAVVMLVASLVLIKWVGRTIRGQLGPPSGKRAEPLLAAPVDGAPGALVKLAIERGLVTSAQLAAMTPAERQFLLLSMKDTLGAVPARAPAAARAAPFRLHCPMCGNALDARPPLQSAADCARCGAKTMMREEPGGSYLLNVTPSPYHRRSGP